MFLSLGYIGLEA